MSAYVREGKPAILVDKEYFQIIENNSELYEYLLTHGVEKWEGYKDAEQEYNDDKEQDNEQA